MIDPTTPVAGDAGNEGGATLASYIPMPLRNVQVGDAWPFRGRLVRDDGGHDLPWPAEWEFMRVWIVEVGPGYVIDRVTLQKYEWWTGMEFHKVLLRPPGRGWTLCRDISPWWSWWARWERRRTWEVE